MADKLHRKRKDLGVVKQNKGTILNIKYDLDPRLMDELDSLVNDLYGFNDMEYPFHAAKEKSLEGYNSHFVSQS